LVLPDPDRRISRLQAWIIYNDGQYGVHNASTSNPMYVNGIELSPGSSQTLASGDELRAGSYVITVDESSDVAQAPNNPPVGDAPPAKPHVADLSTPILPTDLGSDVDPLLVLGSDGQPKSKDTNPFADLLPEEASAGQDGVKADEPEQPSVNPENSAAAVKPDPPFPTFGTVSTAKANGAFGDILTPISPAHAASSDLSHDTSLQSRHNLEPDSSPNGAPEPERVYPDTRDLSAIPPEAGAPDSSDPPKVQQADVQSPAPKPWTPPLSALAGDPFADLMGPPVESHMARVPTSVSVSQRGAYIPNDFNPLATGGVAQRNSSDPLTPLGRNTQGLTDVIPERTIDSIYAPGAESPSTLAVDPLDESRERALHVEQSVDPMKLFSGETQEVNALLADSQPRDTRSVSDHALEMTSFFRAPAARFESADGERPAATISADIPDQHVKLSDIPSPQQVAMQVENPDDSTAVNQPVAPDTSDLQPPPVQPQPIGSTSSDLMDRELPDTEQNLNGEVAATARSPNLAAAVTPHQAVVRPINVPDATTSHTENLLSAFKHGAGLDDWPEQSITPELMETVGRILQATAQGMVSLLATRATVKQEIHLSVTLINPKSNNPLKFLPDGHTALLQMLGPRMPGFMAPVDAVEEAFEDLITHQTAIAAGTQAAVKALFRRFDPDSIESQNPQNGVSEKMSRILHQARLWNAYKSQYGIIRDEVKDDFFRRLGSDFHEAYNREYGDDSSSRR
jgi:FHA domain-containing protein